MGHTVMGQVICMEYYVEPDLQFDDETEMDTWVWDVPLLLEPEPPPAPPPRSDELQTMLLQAVEPDPAWTLIQHWRSVGPASTWAPLPQQLGHLSRPTLAGGVRRRVELQPPAAVLHVKAFASLALTSFFNCCVVLKSLPALVRHFVRPVSSSPVPGNELCVASFQQFEN